MGSWPSKARWTNLRGQVEAEKKMTTEVRQNTKRDRARWRWMATTRRVVQIPVGGGGRLRGRRKWRRAAGARWTMDRIGGGCLASGGSGIEIVVLLCLVVLCCAVLRCSVLCCVSAGMLVPAYKLSMDPPIVAGMEVGKTRNGGSGPSRSSLTQYHQHSLSSSMRWAETDECLPTLPAPILPGRE
ncbi:hypothetical protein F5Y15DRAFT_73281 [Xylariaceae sp. FL0016]|nr:hypothetical protein F5Y15DRAFT_73281 [Xylariaceae sp. FL0016]